MTEQRLVTIPELKGGTKAWDVVFVLAVGLFINCFGINKGLLAGTEGHRALTAHQMVMTGNWILPRLYDRLYLAKPPLFYWVLAIFEKLSGHANVLIWRLPSALAGTAMAGFFCVITGRWYGRLGGLVAGIASCAMFSLWGQNHTAEIDALNSLACAVTACELIDLGITNGPWARRALIAGIAFAAALLLKGPAAVTVVASALLGPAIFNRTLRPFTRPAIWIALAIGATVLSLYGVLALQEFHRLETRIDTSGVQEAWSKLFTDRLAHLPLTVLLPITLLVYMIPVSFFLPMAFDPAVWRRNNESQLWPAPDRQRLRALIGTMAVACFVTMCYGLIFPRYSYVWMPLACPVAGAVAAAWERGLYSRQVVGWLCVALAASGIAFTVGLVAMGILYHHRDGEFPSVFWAASAIAAVFSYLIIHWLGRDRIAWVGWGIVGLILVSGPPFGILEINDRDRRSAASGSAILDEYFRPGQTITTGHIVLECPEVFYYAGLNVESYPDSLLWPREFTTSRWILFDNAEYDYWMKTAPGRLTRVRPIEQRGIGAVLAWYTTKHDARSTTQR